MKRRWPMWRSHQRNYVHTPDRSDKRRANIERELAVGVGPTRTRLRNGRPST